MGRLLHVAIKVLVGEDGATNTSHPDGLLLYSQAIKGFTHQAVNDTMGAAWTIVCNLVSEGLRSLESNIHHSVSLPSAAVLMAFTTSLTLGNTPPVLP